MLQKLKYVIQNAYLLVSADVTNNAYIKLSFKKLFHMNKNVYDDF